MRDELKALREHIRRQGLKQTSQREAILRLFLDLPDHLTVDEIGRSVQERDRRIGLSTVYRSLKLFVEAGLAWEHQFLGGKTCFEKAWGVEPHDYLVCTQCQRVQAFSDPLIVAVRDKVCGRLKFSPRFNRLEVYGLCDRCRPAAAEDED